MIQIHAGIQYGNEYFKAVSAELIINHPDINAYKKYFQQLSGSLKGRDSTEIYQTYYIFLSYLSGVNYKYPEALSYLSKAYKINPDNITTKQLVSESINKYVVNDRNHDKSIDSIEYYLALFPFLKKDNTLISYLDYCYARSISESFEQDDNRKGNTRLTEYEAFLKENPDFEPNRKNLSQIYQQIGFYYLRKQQYDQAEQSLRKGIRLVPDAPELKGMLKSVMMSRGGSYEYPELMDDNKPVKKYLLAVARAKDNQSTINDNSGKYLVRQWALTGVIENGTEVAADDEKVIFALTEDHKVIYKTVSETSTGIWNYDNSRCLLNLTVEKEKLQLHIIITDISSDFLKGVMYMGNEYNDAMEVVFKSTKE